MGWTTGIRLPEWAYIFFLLRHRFPNGSGIHPFSYPVRIAKCYFVVKTARAWSLPLSFV